jgi:tetratricopeptide (TPR) repeat protein
MTLSRLHLMTVAALLLTALAGHAQTTSPQTSQATQQQATQQTIAPARAEEPAPTAGDMRGMTATGLDEAGDRLRAVKDYVAALECYRAAIRKKPSADYFNKVAITELMLRHPEEAVRSARKAVRKDAHLAEAWNNLGVGFYMLHRLPDAMHSYEKAIALKPDMSSFHGNLAAALMDSKDFGRAMAEFRKTYALDPDFFERNAANGISARVVTPEDHAEFQYMMARLFAGAGDAAQALHFLQAAMEEGYPHIQRVYHDKEFERLREDPRFVELMKKPPVAIR